MDDIYSYTPQRQRCTDVPNVQLMVGRCAKDPENPALQVIVTSGATVHVPTADVVAVVWEFLRLSGEDPGGLVAELAELAVRHKRQAQDGQPS